MSDGFRSCDFNYKLKLEKPLVTETQTRSTATVRLHKAHDEGVVLPSSLHILFDHLFTFFPARTASCLHLTSVRLCACVRLFVLWDVCVRPLAPQTFLSSNIVSGPLWLSAYARVSTEAHDNSPAAVQVTMSGSTVPIQRTGRGHSLALSFAKSC